MGTRWPPPHGWGIRANARFWSWRRATGPGISGGALRAARRGLEQAPDHLELLYYATLLPLDLVVPDLAGEMLPRLELAAREAPGLADDVRAGYLERCEGFARDLAQQQGHRDQRAGAAGRAQLVVAIGGAAMVLATLWLLAAPASADTAPRGPAENPAQARHG